MYDVAGWKIQQIYFCAEREGELSLIPLLQVTQTKISVDLNIHGLKKLSRMYNYAITNYT